MVCLDPLKVIDISCSDVICSVCGMDALFFDYADYSFYEIQNISGLVAGDY